jgi:hypothetical protein
MNRRLLYALVLMAALVAVRYGFLLVGGSDAPVAAADSIPAAEKRLEIARREAATLPGDTENHRKAAAELADREKTMLKAETEQQAQVALLELLQNTGRANQVEIRGSQEARSKALTADYGEVSVAVTFSCGMEQLVNLLTALGNQPELIATSELQISGGSDKRKNVQVRLVVSAPVPRKLIPEKKGAAAF